jgi:hypothetical protein
LQQRQPDPQDVESQSEDEEVDRLNRRGAGQSWRRNLKGLSAPNRRLEEKWPRLSGQTVPFLKWRLAVF